MSEKWYFDNGILWNRETNGQATMTSEFVLPELIAQVVNDANRYRTYIESLESMLVVAFKAIESLPQDALGIGHASGTGEPYPIRDEVLHNIYTQLDETKRTELLQGNEPVEEEG